MKESIIMLLSGFVVFVGLGLFIESIVLMDELEFAMLYTALAYPFLIVWIGLTISMRRA